MKIIKMKIPLIIISFVLVEFSVAICLHISDFCLEDCRELDRFLNDFDFSGELDLDESEESDDDPDDESERYTFCVKSQCF